MRRVCFAASLLCGEFVLRRVCSAASFPRRVFRVELSWTVNSLFWFLPINGTHRLYGQFNILLLTFWLALVLVNFFQAVFIGPGYVPLQWHPKNKDNEKFLLFCQICQGCKPPRARHCQICQRCVLKMDHHCHFISNCCGHFNHTNFVLFVFFAAIGCYHGLQVLVGTVWSQFYWRDFYLHIAYAPIAFSTKAFVATIIAIAFAIGSISALAIVLYFEMKILLLNATGAEQLVTKRA